ncbi:unnamed protein product [Ilex paraguariensis]|uniref:non-specific serine/threonine protein kinase n=1 Tax=Ilex paraguariensis TaxID=185542 RepID=A0ABC8TNK4_9AQUA
MTILMEETRESPETKVLEDKKKQEDSNDKSLPRETRDIPEKEELEDVKNQEDEDMKIQENSDEQSSPRETREIPETEEPEDVKRETQEIPERELLEDVNKQEDIKIQEDSDDESSPRGVLEIPISGSDSDNNSSSFSSSSGSSLNEKSANNGAHSGENQGLHWRNLIDNIKKRSMRRFSSITLLARSELSRKTLRKRLERNHSAEDSIDCEDFLVPKPSWRNFSYEELVAATDNFSPDNMIGKGGHAEVYKGCLSDGEIVAVKRITKKEKNDEDRVGDFLSELGIIAHINHPNAAKLVGFSADNGLHLVLQFLPHGSLSSLLHGSTKNLEWNIRFRVALGVAEGLQYLHCECQRRIIHRDITASNILLTEDYEPQISDFGLARWLPEKWTHHVVSPIEGTFGYMAPEYFMHGIVDEKTDVFAFGVLLLELITGRRAVDSCRQSLVMWV